MVQWSGPSNGPTIGFEVLFDEKLIEVSFFFGPLGPLDHLL